MLNRSGSSINLEFIAMTFSTNSIKLDSTISQSTLALIASVSGRVVLITSITSL